MFAAARVKGAQGSDYSEPDKVVTSVKHYAAYGQPEGGRDYNTTDMSEQRLRNFYLPPFKAAIDAGADTVMCSFNAISGVPGCANRETETDILKHEWGFDGFIESDYTAVAELRACPPKTPDEGPCGHGVAADGAGRGGPGAERRHRLRDGQHVHPRLRRAAARAAADLDGAARRRRAPDPAREVPRRAVRAPVRRPGEGRRTRAASCPTPTAAAARTAAGRSMVLLKNDGGTLPLDPTKKTAVIGPLGNDRHDMLGPWWGRGEDADAVTVFDGIKAQSPGATLRAGLHAAQRRAAGRTTRPSDCGSDARLRRGGRGGQAPTRSCSRSARRAR